MLRGAGGGEGPTEFHDVEIFQNLGLPPWNTDYLILTVTLWNTLLVIISSISQLEELRMSVPMASLGPQTKSVLSRSYSCIRSLSLSRSNANRENRLPGEVLTAEIVPSN